MPCDTPITETPTLEQVIEQIGGIEALDPGPDEFHEIFLRMDMEQAALTEQHPDKWVALGKNEFLAAGASIDEVCLAAETVGLDASDYVVRFPYTKPPVFIL